MALQYQLDSLEGLDESISKLYVEKDGKFFLDVTGHEKPEDKNKIPKSRLDQEIEKRKGAESELKELAEELKSDIPEEFKELVPDLPPSKLIKWIREANRKGLFDPKNEGDTKELDKKRPSQKKAEDLDSLSPYAKMARGYKS